MKYFLCLIFIAISGQAYSQVISYPASFISDAVERNSPRKFTTQKLDIMPDMEATKLISVRTTNSHFHRTYLINKEGLSISSGFMPASYFMPTDNLIVISGMHEKKDSFNPYGAYDMTSMVLFSTFNSFISKLKINRR